MTFQVVFETSRKSWLRVSRLHTFRVLLSATQKTGEITYYVLHCFQPRLLASKKGALEAAG
jgi:hypothetical protein